MLPVKSKYKIGKRLGPGIFEQLQTQKFALSEARSRGKRDKKGRRPGSDYGRQLLEKQRLRYTYGLTERQLSNYAMKAMTASDPLRALHVALEMRADSVIYRAGFAPTRRAARQLVSHRHVRVNDRPITIPSFSLKVGDVVSAREGSRGKGVFAHLTAEKEEGASAPAWLTVERTMMRAEVTGEPPYTPGSGIDYSTVFEFYSR